MSHGFGCEQLLALFYHPDPHPIWIAPRSSTGCQMSWQAALGGPGQQQAALLLGEALVCQQCELKEVQNDKSWTRWSLTYLAAALCAASFLQVGISRIWRQ